MAIACGTNLLIATFILLPLKYFTSQANNSTFMSVYAILWTLHGYLYMIYLLTVLQLGVKKGISFRTMTLLCLAGTVPFASFIAERKIVRQYS